MKQVMSTFRKLRRIIGLGSLAALIANPSSAQGVPKAAAGETEIWFSPVAWEISKVTHGIDYTAHDFQKLLLRDAPWQRAAAHTHVVLLPANVVWSYPDRQAVVRFFHDHGFETAFSFGMLFDDGQCPKGIEGVSQDHDFNHEAVKIAKLWKDAGGNLDYVLMDAPLGYGHFIVPSCSHPIDDVARRAAATFNHIRSYFPGVRAVDAEGPARLPDTEWFVMMDSWLDAFRKHTGQSIDLVALDLHWRDLRPGNSWQETTRRSVVFFHERGVRTGLIINDDRVGPGVTNISWMDANRRHVDDVAHRGGLGLDCILFSSWMGYPRDNLPEDNPDAYTSLVDYAFHKLHPRN